MCLLTHRKYVAIILHIYSNTKEIMHTTIIVNKQTRDNLKKIGQKGQTYDDLLQKLIKKMEQ